VSVVEGGAVGVVIGADGKYAFATGIGADFGDLDVALLEIGELAESRVCGPDVVVGVDEDGLGHRGAHLCDGEVDIAGG